LAKFTLAYELGLSFEEIDALPATDVDIYANLIRIVNKKSGVGGKKTKKRIR